MAPTGCADSEGEAGRGGDVVDNVVGPGRVGTDPTGNVVELESVSRAPGDVVVGAGRVAADADGSDEDALRVVEGEAAAKDIDAADAAADHRVLRCSVIGGITAVGHEYADGIAGLQAEQR